VIALAGSARIAIVTQRSGWLVLLLLVLAGAAFRADAQDAGAAHADSQAAAQPRILQVAVTGSAPFVVTEGSGVDGLSVAVFRRAAERLHLRYELLPVASVEEGLTRIERKQADLLIGPISILAARAERVVFTQPYDYSSLALASPESSSLWTRMRGFFNEAFLGGVVVFLCILTAVGALLWRMERKHNPEQFPPGAARGIGNGIWMALVTMTTVGYGDRVPITLRGRVVAGVWMLFSMLAASSITAFLATALTVAQIGRAQLATAEELSGHRIAVVDGTVSERFARTYGAKLVVAKDIGGALDSLSEGRAEGIVFDEPVLRYTLQHRPELGLQISPATYWPQGYGFALPRDSSDTTLRDRLNVELLKLQESGELESMRSRWLY
jgi:polar amino acid transport system substrate-binding protein